MKDNITSKWHLRRCSAISVSWKRKSLNLACNRDNTGEGVGLLYVGILEISIITKVLEKS